MIGVEGFGACAVVANSARILGTYLLEEVDLSQVHLYLSIGLVRTVEGLGTNGTQQGNGLRVSGNLRRRGS